jgi:hypothetical protein
VGIGRRVAELWGFCGARRSLWLARPTAPGLPKYRGFRISVTTFRVTQRHRSDLLACGNSAPNDAPMFVKERYSKPHVIEKKKSPRAASNASS